MESKMKVALRITDYANRGNRNYMEDMRTVAYLPTADDKDIECCFFAIFDGHGGKEAALYTKNNLMDNIVDRRNFRSKKDELVLKAIKDGFLATHNAMKTVLGTWPKTPSGFPSTSGTTASIGIIRGGKLYIGHVGDSRIVLGYEDPPGSGFWKARPLTKDHKPTDADECARINSAGGKVEVKSGVSRVVWNRPRIGKEGQLKRSTIFDEIPFLAVARSLGDLWSYNSKTRQYIVSPEPDVSVLEIDANIHRCLIFGSDGLWDVLSSQEAVNGVYYTEKQNEKTATSVDPDTNWIDPSNRLVYRALNRWIKKKMSADNISAVTIMIDPLAPPKVSSTKKSVPKADNSASISKLVRERNNGRINKTSQKDKVLGKANPLKRGMSVNCDSLSKILKMSTPAIQDKNNMALEIVPQQSTTDEGIDPRFNPSPACANEGNEFPQMSTECTTTPTRLQQGQVDDEPTTNNVELSFDHATQVHTSDTSTIETSIHSQNWSGVDAWNVFSASENVELGVEPDQPRDLSLKEQEDIGTLLLFAAARYAIFTSAFPMLSLTSETYKGEDIYKALVVHTKTISEKEKLYHLLGKIWNEEDREKVNKGVHSTCFEMEEYAGTICYLCRVSRSTHTCLPAHLRKSNQNTVGDLEPADNADDEMGSREVLSTIGQSLICTLCTKTFKHSGTVINHMMDAHGGSMFHCIDCSLESDKQFSSMYRRNVERHQHTTGHSGILEITKNGDMNMA